MPSCLLAEQFDGLGDGGDLGCDVVDLGGEVCDRVGGDCLCLPPRGFLRLSSIFGGNAPSAIALPPKLPPDFCDPVRFRGTKRDRSKEEIPS